MKCSKENCYRDALDISDLCDYHFDLARDELEIEEMIIEKDGIFDNAKRILFADAVMTTCDRCGKDVHWSFDPDPELPNYAGICGCVNRMWFMCIDTVALVIDDDSEIECEMCHRQFGPDAAPASGNVMCMKCGRYI